MRFLFLCSFFLVFLIPLTANGQWQLDGTILTSPSVGTVTNPLVAVRDEAGGAILVWPQGGAIFAQRIDASGVVQWSAAGVQVCAKILQSNTNPALCPDGTGGAFFTWVDFRDVLAINCIYAQRVDASGVPQWPANGVAITTTQGNSWPGIVSDGAGGAIIMWETSADDMFAQRVDASGAPQWGAGGVNIGTALTAAFYHRIVADGAGGAIVAWSDSRNGFGDTNVYIQRVNASGTPLWAVDGAALCTAVSTQSLNDLVRDDDGNVIAVWSDARGGENDIYVQKVNGGGIAQWTANGVAACVAAGAQGAPVVTGDGFGGAIAVWMDPRTGVPDIYAQRLNLWGIPQWAADGIALCAAVGDQEAPVVVSDGGGGVIAAWADERAGGFALSDVYAQRVTGAGVSQWDPDGTPVCSVPLSFQAVVAIASDDAGGAIVGWMDSRPGAGGMYAQRITYESGLWGRPEGVITSVADVPGDQGGRVAVNWEASQWDALGYTEITHYSVWRATEPFPSASLPAGSVVLDDPSEVRADFSGSAYWVDPAAGEPYYWEWLGNQVILNSPGYSFSAATRADSTLEGSADHHFRVVSHTDDPFVFWRSNVAMGRSVDDLAPAAPFQFTVERLTTNVPPPGSSRAGASAPGDVLLTWVAPDETDLRDFSIYRSTSSDVEPTPMYFLASTDEMLYIDTTAPLGQSFYYVLTANDVHGNASAATGVASVGPSTGVDRTPLVKALTLLPNRPNPFTGTTELEIGLVANSTVEIEVYDVVGRVVRRTTLGEQRAGWLKVPFDGRSDAGRLLASGVYFCRVEANGTAVTRKMVIAR